MKTIKELADIGTAASKKVLHRAGIDFVREALLEETARQAFAQAVRDAVLADLVTKPDSSPTTKTIPLDMGDIRATDEFKSKGAHVIETADYWCDNEVGLAWSGDTPTYAALATYYLRRQHGSDEWKPCTKEVSV